MRWDYLRAAQGHDVRRSCASRTLLTATTLRAGHRHRACFHGGRADEHAVHFEVAPFKLADRDIQASFWLRVEPA